MLNLNPKMREITFLFFYFLGMHLTKICSLACLKVKLEQKVKTKFVYYILDQKPFRPFLEES